MEPSRIGDPAGPSFANAPRDLPRTHSTKDIDADYALITGFLADELSSDDRRWVEYLLGNDSRFRNLAEPQIRKWGVSLGYTPDADLGEIIDRIHFQRTSKRSRRRIRRTEEGIAQASPSGRRPHASSLEPKKCVERLVVAWGSRYAKRLTKKIHNLVMRTGKPDPWIAEIARARALGAIGRDDANHLILKLACAATMILEVRDPRYSLLPRLAEMDPVRWEQGVVEDEDRDESDGDPEWEAALHAEVERDDELVMEILLRNREVELAEEYLAWRRDLIRGGGTSAGEWLEYAKKKRTMASVDNDGSRAVDDTEPAITDDLPLPCNAVIESWFSVEVGQMTRPLEALLTAYLKNELPREYRGRVEERLARDPLCHGYLDEIARAIDAAEREVNDVEATRANNDRRRGSATRRWDLEFQGIPIPSEHAASRRSGTQYRLAFRQWNATPCGVSEFVQRLLDELGTQSAIELVDHAFCVVSATGEPDSWIREVGRARQRGVLSSEVAYFLVWQFAASAIPQLSEMHPVLAKLSAKIDRIEGEFGNAELETWANHAGPPEWETLCEEWDTARDALLKQILERNEEYEVLRDHLRDETPYKEGRFQIYGV